MITDGNEPINIDPTYGNVGSVGLTKREYFTGLAMQGMLINGAETQRSGKSYNQRDIAIYAVIQADALIEELNNIPK